MPLVAAINSLDATFKAFSGVFYDLLQQSMSNACTTSLDARGKLDLLAAAKSCRSMTGLD